MKVFNFTVGISGLDRRDVELHFDDTDVTFVLHNGDLIFLEFEKEDRNIKDAVRKVGTLIESVGGTVEQVWTENIIV